MKCKDCGKKIKNWLRVLLFHRFNLKYCIWCSTTRLVGQREKFISIGMSYLDIDNPTDNYCPLWNDISCIPGLDVKYSNCPYKDGWRSCIHYIESLKTPGWYHI